MVVGELIQRLREERGYSQEYVAGELKVSRPTYAAIEQGVRDLMLKEAEVLASLYDMTLEEFISGKASQIDVVLKQEKKVVKKQEYADLRISVPQHKVEKFKEVLLYILEKVGSKPNVGMAVLYKLLYFIDFDYYEKYEGQLMGATYIKNHFGPTPVEFLKISEQMIKNGELEKVKSKYFTKDQTKYLPHRKSNLSLLSAQEIKHIDDVLARLSDKNGSEISDYSHKDVPWIMTQEQKPIDYEAVFYRTDETSVREYAEDHL